MKNLNYKKFHLFYLKMNLEKRSFFKMKIMFIGDIYGQPGIDYLKEKMSFLKNNYKPNLIVANAENAYKGRGLSYKNYKNLTKSGVNAITMGNHIWDNSELTNFIDNTNIVKPINDLLNIGIGYKIINFQEKKVLIINALGRVFIDDKLPCPFKKIENILYKCNLQYNFSFLDFHAEATSEKISLAHYFDGKIDAIVGTHTHVQTNDDRILPKKTLYITDVGMTGCSEGVIGKQKESMIRSFLDRSIKIPKPNAVGKRQLNGVLLTLDNIKKIEKINLQE